MENCIFCKIIKGEIPCHKIYEDESTLAFLDISNDHFGHTLVIPKEHYANIIQTPEQTLNKCINSAKAVAEHFVNTLDFGGTHMFINTGECAGQSVFHLHIHVIPKVNELKTPKVNLNLKELSEIAKKLRMF